LVGEIQLRLKAIEKFVQAALDDVFRVRVGQLGAQLAKPLLSGIAIHADRRARDRARRVVSRVFPLADPVLGNKYLRLDAHAIVLHSVLIA
jgi:hypothetical protein